MKKDSFLDYGEKEYGKSFVDDVKALGSIVYMFLPFPIFWALFDQQVSFSFCIDVTLKRNNNNTSFRDQDGRFKPPG